MLEILTEKNKNLEDLLEKSTEKERQIEKESEEYKNKAIILQVNYNLL